MTAPATSVRLALASMYGRPLAWRSDSLMALQALAEQDADLPALQAAIPRGGQRSAVAPKIGVLPLTGVLTFQPSLFSYFGFGTSLREATVEFRQMVADTSVDGILLVVDSPGGEVSGVPEFAAEIRAARKIKPVAAIAATEAASAAYWIASQASPLVVMASGSVGSVGVFVMHVDQSARNAQQGLSPTFIHAAPFKVEGNPHEPLSKAARTYLQSQVDEVYDMFVADVAKGRGVTEDVVRRTFGQGRMVSARSAVAGKMADRVGTLEETAVRIIGGKNGVAAQHMTRLSLERSLELIDRT